MITLSILNFIFTYISYTFKKILCSSCVPVSKALDIVYEQVLNSLVEFAISKEDRQVKKQMRCTAVDKSKEKR